MLSTHSLICGLMPLAYKNITLTCHLDSDSSIWVRLETFNNVVSDELVSRRLITLQSIPIMRMANAELFSGNSNTAVKSLWCTLAAWTELAMCMRPVWSQSVKPTSINMMSFTPNFLRIYWWAASMVFLRVLEESQYLDTDSLKGRGCMFMRLLE